LAAQPWLALTLIGIESIHLRRDTLGHQALSATT